MNEISIIEYKNGTKVLIYSKIEIKTEKQGIKNIVLRIIGDKELENIKDMNIKDVIKLIDNILNGQSVF